MQLNDHEQAMLAGEFGEPRRRALAQQMQVGRFFDAVDFVEIAQVHLMADTESLGEAGVVWLEELAAYPEEERRVRVPTVTDPRGVDFDAYKRLRQQDSWEVQQQRALDAFTAMGFLMTDTCINYQTVMPPALGEHVAFGDTDSTIYANPVCGARGMAPAALLLNTANPIMAQGAALADLPLMDRFEEDITAAIRTGDTVAVDPAKGLVRVEA